MHEFRRIGLKCFEPYGAFYVFPDVSGVWNDIRRICHEVSRGREGGSCAGDCLGASGEGFIRISYAYSLEDLKVALGRLERFIDV